FILVLLFIFTFLFACKNEIINNDSNLSISDLIKNAPSIDMVLPDSLQLSKSNSKSISKDIGDVQTLDINSLPDIKSKEFFKLIYPDDYGHSFEVDPVKYFFNILKNYSKDHEISLDQDISFNSYFEIGDLYKIDLGKFKVKKVDDHIEIYWYFKYTENEYYANFYLFYNIKYQNEKYLITGEFLFDVHSTEPWWWKQKCYFDQNNNEYIQINYSSIQDTDDKIMYIEKCIKNLDGSYTIVSLDTDSLPNKSYQVIWGNSNLGGYIELYEDNENFPKKDIFLEFYNNGGNLFIRKYGYNDNNVNENFFNEQFKLDLYIPLKILLPTNEGEIKRKVKEIQNDSWSYYDADGNYKEYDYEIIYYEYWLEKDGDPDLCDGNDISLDSYIKDVDYNVYKENDSWKAITIPFFFDPYNNYNNIPSFFNNFDTYLDDYNYIKEKIENIFSSQFNELVDINNIENLFPLFPSLDLVPKL
ncbi:MAG TPA: hypothetical protein PLF21_03935, partial [Exilispira sp.]|nr:hypothetical protein [Exilispira sp.]